MKNSQIHKEILYPIIWLWIPILWLLSQLSLEFFLTTSTILKLHAENGPHEFIQFILITASFFIAAFTLLKMDRRENPWLTAWVCMSAICCFYVGAEEISWGQSFFGWVTPDNWVALNEQNETNFHNTSRWLNQIPRYGLMAGIAIGGLILPALSFLKLSPLRLFKPSENLEIIFPSNILSVTALCLLIAALGHKISKILFDTKLFERSSEVEEIFMFFFVLLYMIILKQRILTTPKKQHGKTK